MKKKTIKDQVADTLLKKGWIDNFYCIDTRLTTRLSDAIFNLQKEGWEFDDDKSGYLNPKQPKNWYYVVKKAPYKIVTRTLSNGETITSYART